MSGRGKGGKGLGKGGAKRHRKVLRDNIQGITKVRTISSWPGPASTHMIIPHPLFRHSLPSAVWLAVVVSSVSLDSSTRKLVEC